jgi:hypothetical protein
MKFANVKRNKADVVHVLYVLKKGGGSLIVLSNKGQFQ